MTILFRQMILIALLGLTEIVFGQVPCTLEESNSIQLNNSGVFSIGSAAGRVDICHCTSNSSCSWQTVSAGSLTVPFSWKNSIVVCRELEYFDVQSPILQNTVPLSNLAPPSVAIYGNTFECDGTESALSECDIGESTTNLTHFSDAYVTCQTSITVNKVRLVGDPNPDRGVVEIYRSQSSDWVTICPDSWTDALANFTCSSLGYQSGTAAVYVGPFKGSEINTETHISSVTCSAGVSSFSLCSFVQNTICESPSRWVAVAVCVPDTISLDGSVQLSSIPSSPSYDRVEVLYNGRWGTVCDIQWDSIDGQVACTELGRDFVSVPSAPPTFNSLSSKPIYVLSYNCLGTEINLASCISPLYPVGFVGGDCSHANDAGLSCGSSSSDDSGNSYSSIVSSTIFAIFFLIICLSFFLFFFKDWFKEHNPIEWCCGCLESCYQIITCRDCDCDNDCITCPSLLRHEERREQPVVMVDRQPRRFSSNSSSSSGSDSELRVTNTFPSTSNTRHEQHEEKELTKVAPPSYNDALRLEHVNPPPEYEEQKEPPLPYPIMSNFDPAHPPSPHDYQGYPPPTVQSGDDQYSS